MNATPWVCNWPSGCASTATASGADRRLNLAALLWSQARTRVW
jgi:hypothetical protein